MQKSQEANEMKKDKSPTSSTDKKKDLVSKLFRLSIDNNVFEGSTDLPQVFQVYLTIFISYLYFLQTLFSHSDKLFNQPNRNIIYIVFLT